MVPASCPPRRAVLRYLSSSTCSWRIRSSLESSSSSSSSMRASLWRSSSTFSCRASWRSRRLPGALDTAMAPASSVLQVYWGYYGLRQAGFQRTDPDPEHFRGNISMRTRKCLNMKVFVEEMTLRRSVWLQMFSCSGLERFYSLKAESCANKSGTVSRSGSDPGSVRIQASNTEVNEWRSNRATVRRSSETSTSASGAHIWDRQRWQTKRPASFYFEK